MTPTAPAPDPKRMRTTAVLSAVFALSMLGAAFAAVPLYNLICRVTGYGGATQVADQAPHQVLDRTITVRFDSNVAPGLGWEFEPEQREVTVRVGETKMVYYKARNLSGRESWGTATYNVTPERTGAYFNKLQCFCFTEQKLAAGESIDMPVVFFIDPQIVEERELDKVDTITLSYTFFAAKPPAKSAAVKTQEPKL